MEKMTTKRLDAGFSHPFHVSVVDRKWCEHRHATRQDARDCGKRRLIAGEEV